MSEAQERAVSLLRLGDAEHAAFSEAARDTLIDRLAAALDSTVPVPKPGEESPSMLPPVLAISVPSRWEARGAEELPLLLATRTTGLRDWQVSVGGNTQLVITSLDAGTTWTRRLGGSPKRARPPRPSMTGPRPDDINARAYGIDVAQFSAVLKSMRSSWEPGRYAITAVVFDWKSNTVSLTMTGGSDAPASRSPIAATPPLIEQRDVDAPTTGVAFRLPARAASSDPLLVQVVVSLPVSELALVPQQGQLERFVMLGTLLLVRLDAEDPLRIDLAIPVGRRAPGSSVMTMFALDARAALGRPLPRGWYQAYLMFGAVVSGPQPLSIE